MKIIVIAGLVAVIASLFSALYYLYHDRGQGTRMVRALAIRVALSAALVVVPGRLLQARVDRADRSPVMEFTPGGFNLPAPHALRRRTAGKRGEAAGA